MKSLILRKLVEYGIIIVSYALQNIFSLGFVIHLYIVFYTKFSHKIKVNICSYWLFPWFSSENIFRHNFHSTNAALFFRIMKADLNDWIKHLRQSNQYWLGYNNIIFVSDGILSKVYNIELRLKFKDNCIKLQTKKNVTSGLNLTFDLNDNFFI